MDDDLEAFGARVKALRKQHGLTQQELASRMYASTAAVSNWEAGKAKPYHNFLRGLAGALGTTVAYLTTGEGPVANDETWTELENATARLRSAWRGFESAYADHSAAVAIRKEPT